MLFQLTYASRPHNLKPDDLKNILQSSSRNNGRLGVTGALCLSNGIFLQQLEGERLVINNLYHHILKDPRHKDPAILDFSTIVSRQFGKWSMGMISSTPENRDRFLKYATTSEFDPYQMSQETLRAFFSEVPQEGGVRWIL